MCTYQYIINHCSCFLKSGPDFGCKTPCTLPDQIQCGLNRYKYINNNIQDICGEMCPLECESIEYDQSISASDFPSDGYAEYLYENSFLKTKYPLLNASDLKSNFIELQIYYPALKYTEISQSPQYSGSDLISSIGGTLGNFFFN